MDPAEAKHIIDPDAGYVESVRRNARGWSGERNYRVDTAIAEEAMFASGLPAMGDSWGPKLPLLRVVEIGPPVRLGGRDPEGWSRVPVRYETPTFGSVREIPDAGKQYAAWTKWVPGVGTQHISFPVERFSQLPNSDDYPIANGDGADIFVGQFEARVQAWYPLAEALPIRRWVELSQIATLNDATMRLPRVFGAVHGLEFERGQLLYLGPGMIEAVDQWISVEHVFKAAKDWAFAWEAEDAAGKRTGEVVKDRLYEYADLSGLWRE